MLSKSLGKRPGMSTDENGWARVLCRHFRLRLLFLLLHYDILRHFTTYIHELCKAVLWLLSRGAVEIGMRERYLKRAAANVHMAVFGNLVCNLLNSSTKNSPGSDFQGVTSRYELQESSVDVRLGGGQKQGIEAQLLPLLASPSS